MSQDYVTYVLTPLISLYALNLSFSSWAHIDKCWARYAIAWCLDRVVQKPGIHNGRIIRTNHSGENKDLWPSGGGGNFVDITLRLW